MRKLQILFCILFCAHLLVAQRSALYISEDRLFYEGKSMYDDKNYAGCIHKLIEYKKIAKNPDLIQESEFLSAASEYKQGGNVTVKLKDYLDTYPETRHYDEVCFMIGSRHFAEADYAVAIYWLNKADMDNLSVPDQEDFAYRMAYSCFQTNKKDEAFRLFGILKDKSTKYGDASTFYYAYLLYQDGKLNEALPLFSRLKNHPDFKKDAAYYLTQINFMQGRYSQTIKEGKELLTLYPDHPDNWEVNRLIGVSYYHETDYFNAAKYISQYVQHTDNPIRGDLYLLGLSNYNIKNYKEAIKYLSKSVRESDDIGQNSYLYLGQSYLKTGDNKNALMAFEAASRMNFDPQIREASMYNYAILLHQMSSSAFGESVTVLENFLNEYPNSKYTDKINDCLVEVYLTTKNYQTALKSIDKIKNPGTKILEARQKIYYHLGTVYFTNTVYKDAVDYFTKAIDAGEYAPAEKEKSYYWRAESYYRLDKYNDAIRDYRQFLQIARSSSDLVPDAYYGIGYCYFRQYQYESAQTNFTGYIEKESDRSAITYADAYARLGDCYFYNRKFAEAEQAYSKSAELQPSMADYTVFQKGFVLGLQKNYTGKVTQMDKLINTYPDSRYIPDALYEKGRANVMMDRSMEAIHTYEILLEKYPESEYARKAGTQIGLLYFNLNQYQNAIKSYKKVVEKYPGSEEAKVAVQDLKSVYVDMNDINGYAEYINSLGGIARFEATEQDSLTYIVAERFFMKNDVKKAEEAMIKYLQSFPEGAFKINAHYYLGNIHYNHKEYGPAKTELEKVLNAGDNKFTEKSLVLMSEMAYNSKEYESALRYYQRLQNVAQDKSSKDAATLGVVRCSWNLEKYMDVINAASLLLKEPKLQPEEVTEATYYRAKSYLFLNEKSKAQADLSSLASDTRTVYGAEAKYLLSQYYFDNKEMKKAESEVTDYIKKGTPHSYWLARSFILLSDIYISQRDYLQARQYLESLEHNYKNNDDDIHTRISENKEKIKRLERIN